MGVGWEWEGLVMMMVVFTNTPTPAGAMTPEEELTVLGRHLSTLPIEPTIGKALIYSVLLRCVFGWGWGWGWWCGVG